MIGYALYTDQNSHRRFGVALAVALAIHAAIITGVSFSRTEQPPDIRRQMGITLSSSAASEVEDAQHLAAQDQEGSGEKADEDKLTHTDPNAGNSLVPALPPSANAIENKASHIIATLAKSQPRKVTQLDRTREQVAAMQGISPKLDSLSQTLLGLQANLDEETAAYARRPKVSRVTSVAAKGSVEADYLLRWRQRVEQVGNKYYPQASVRFNIYGSLRMVVTLRSDGHIASTEVLSSSGYGVLDEAAIKIVRMAAPYPPFPQALAARADTLEIIRTWQFMDNRLSSTE